MRICHAGITVLGMPTIVELLVAREPLSLIHDTEDGPIHLWTLPDKDGAWEACFWGIELAGTRRFRTMAQANSYLLGSFARMFPTHSCTDRCRTGAEVAQRKAAMDLHFHQFAD